MVTKTKRANKRKSAKRGKKRDGDILQGSPITIGGGGGLDEFLGTRRSRLPVGCEFNHQVYPEPSGGQGMKEFRNQAFRMVALRMAVDGVVTDLTPFLPDDNNCTVTLRCQNDNDKLTLRGNPLGIRLHTGRYPKQGADDYREHQNAAVYIGKVEVRGGSGLSITKEFTAMNYFAVQASNMPFPEEKSKSRRAKR